MIQLSLECYSIIPKQQQQHFNTPFKCIQFFRNQLTGNLRIRLNLIYRIKIKQKNSILEF